MHSNPHNDAIGINYINYETKTKRIVAFQSSLVSENARLISIKQQQFTLFGYASMHCVELCVHLNKFIITREGRAYKICLYRCNTPSTKSMIMNYRFLPRKPNM